MKTAIDWCPNTGRLLAIEDKFHFEIPRTIGLRLKKYLRGQVSKAAQSTCIGEWILSLPPDERLSVNIKFLS